ncbi:hypothetical protein ABT369_38815 [Dactylosporangium sp. NPDC000244]|uniref:hypothetical protein n=1 Tax=Dactylosporangium sp. NPDC000244 TaxID=3154365 RepID=UPI00331F8376
MTDQQMYQVTAECVYATVDSQYGMTRQLLLKGAVIPGDAKEIEHLVAQGLIAKIGDGDETGINALGGVGAAESVEGAAGSVVSPDPAAGPMGGSPSVTDEAETAREAARAKLPADGSAPHPNAGRDVWVEYAVKQGIDRAEAQKATKDDLKALFKS